jgi:hypothetical protein
MKINYILRIINVDKKDEFTLQASEDYNTFA